ncbi:MAG: nucleotidyl transferase AbiEii/AbiGii toxin family protein [Candidatus Micrarchaeota archaeon]
MISKDELTRIAAKKGFPPHVIEKDYALTWTLKALYSNQKLSKYLVFKGGTCLSKVYADIYRLSEDLDFSAYKEGKMDSKMLFDEIAKAFASANAAGAPNLAIILDSIHENPGMVMLKIRYSGILEKSSNLKMEISLNEWIQFESKHAIIKERTYPDIEPFELHCYDLIEILSEKLRAIMQRGKTRDYYDAWQITARRDLLGDAKGDLANIRLRLKEKCTRNKIAYEPEKMFEEKRLDAARGEWENGLERLVKELPKFEDVVGDLAEIFRAEKELAQFKAKPDFENIRNLWRDNAANLLLTRAIDIAVDELVSKRAAEIEAALNLLTMICMEIPKLKDLIGRKTVGFLAILESDQDRKIKDAVMRLKNALTQV